MKIPSMLAGVAGEYFVAAELSRRGYIASISLRNTRGIDFLATNQEGTRSVTIQCKANQLSQKEWMLNEKAENFASENHFYVFVVLRGIQDRPFFHIVPSKEVARYVKTSHNEWFSTPGRVGQKHQDTTMRKFSDEDDKFFEKWISLVCNSLCHFVFLVSSWCRCGFRCGFRCG